MANDKNIFDYVFVGMGASNSLILISLIKNGLVKNKKVAVLELDSKAKNDKTYCFWAAPDEPIVSELSSIISFKFSNIRINGSKVQAIDTCPYHYIRSVDLYTTTFEMLEEAQIDFFQCVVTNLTRENQIYMLQTPNETYYSKYVFDSRPPNYDVNLSNDIHLYQSFYGLHIKCHSDVFDTNTFDMMNFNVEQNEFTQFIYVIPFSPKEALVELTRFGAEKIDMDYALNLLENFIAETFGSYEKLDTEVGCIPMSTFENPVHQYEGVLKTGASANLIKPSTGYGFKNMFYFAKVVTESIASKNLSPINKIIINTKKRFKFYDKLLLIILLHWPSLGKKIFTSLFSNVPAQTIFSFLEEKTSFREEMSIFIALPIKPFIKALMLYIKNKGVLRYLFALITVVVFLFISRVDDQTAQNFNYLVLIFGFFSIGIPHGAVDHMLTKRKKTPISSFILNYMLLIGAYLLIWYLFPVLSLFIFVAYSAFHFGESELIQNKEEIDAKRKYIKAFLLGLSILLFIVSTHREESIAIISKMIGVDNLSGISIDLQTWSSIASLASISYIVLTFLRSMSISSFGMLFLVVLGIQVPLSMAFGLYFIVQHSFNAWSHLKTGLNMNSRDLYLKSLPFTFGALLLFSVMIYFLYNSVDISGIWPVFFVFIACISLPHFILMHLFYASK